MRREHRIALEQRSEAWESVQRLQRLQTTRDLTDDEANEYRQALDEVERLSPMIESYAAEERLGSRAIAPGQGDTNPIPDGHGTTTAEERVAQLADGRPLDHNDTFSAWVRDRRAAESYIHGRSQQAGGDNLHLGRYLRGLFTGNWDRADAERRAMAEGTQAAGGYLVPMTLAAELIDLARPQARVLEAGARLVPMSSVVLDVPTWASDPTPAWRAENQLINQSDGAVGKIRLTARSLATIVRVSRELLEDAPSVEQALTNAASAQFSLSLDYAALYGDGAAADPDTYPDPAVAAAGGPLGLKNRADVTKTALAANGTALSYDHLIDAVGRRADVNERVTAAIMSPRTHRGLSKIKDTTGQYLTPPPALDDVALLDTNQVPNDVEHGTSEVTSDVFVGDYSQLYIGVRTQLQIIPLRERYAEFGQIGFLFWFRGDVAPARPSAFEVLTGAL